MQIKSILFYTLATSLVASAPLVADQNNAVAEREVEPPVAQPVVARAPQDRENNPQPPEGIQDFFDRLQGKKNRTAAARRPRPAPAAASLQARDPINIGDILGSAPVQNLLSGAIGKLTGGGKGKPAANATRPAP